MAEDIKNKPQAQNQINIELSEEIAEGIYSNLAMIAHSNSEFVIDFIRLMPGVPKAKVKSRIVITPEHAKRFLLALKDNIEKYETSFGPIKRTDDMPKFGILVEPWVRPDPKWLKIKVFRPSEAQIFLEKVLYPLILMIPLQS
jgi:hypothetical protein